MMAVPQATKDSWSKALRTPVVGGNWKSNGDRDFISTFPKELLNIEPIFSFILYSIIENDRNNMDCVSV